MKRLIVFIVGPTAVGKSEIAAQVAKKIRGEIISCDSMQVYKDMDIVSQIPAAKLTKQIPHHLIEILSPEENFSAADFRKTAILKIKQIYKRKKVPIVVGGSGLYVKALVDGLFACPPADEKLRSRLLKEENIHGRGFLYERLKKADPLSASKIHPNDLRRTIRALEIYKKTKMPISQLKKNTKGLGRNYNIKIFGLIMNRQQLYKRTDRRVDKMFKTGLIEQIKKLARYNLSKTAFSAVGIKEINDFLGGKYSLEYARYLLKRNTRRLVKKQLTWFRPDKRIIWINIGLKDKINRIVEKIIKKCQTN